MGIPSRSDSHLGGPDVAKIALFIQNLGGGGAERVVVNLAQGFMEQGHTVHLVVGQAIGPYSDKLPPNVHLIDLQQGRILRCLPGLVAYLRRERPDTLLCALNHPNLIGIWATLLAGWKNRVIVSVHSSFQKQPSHRSWRLLLRLMRWFYPYADAVVTVSAGVREEVLALMPRLDPRRVHPIHNPIYSPALAVQAEQPVEHSWLADRTAPVVVAVGRLTRQKDFGTLIRAFGLVASQIPARLIVLGEGEERPTLEQLVVELGLTEKVHMPGFVSNPFQYVARADLFVLSSETEGFGNVIVEALSVGTPVVSTSCPNGPDEILDGGRYGRLVPVGDPQQLSVAIIASLQDSHDKEALQRRAEDFSVERISQQYLNLIVGGQRQRTVLMLGPSLTVRGGIASVEAALLNNWPVHSRYNLCHIPTQVEGIWWRKVWVACKAVLTTLVSLVRRPAAVHIHFASRLSFYRKSVLILLARTFNVPVILHAHGGEFHLFYGQEAGPLTRRYIRYVLSSATRLLVLSDQWKNFYASLYRRSEPTVLFNSVAYPTEVLTQRAGFPIILFLGRMVREKGIDDLIAAMPSVLVEHPDAQLWIGGADDNGRIAAVLESLPWRNQIRMLGWVQGGDKDRALREATLLVLPSYNEGLPMVVIEAMAHGLPVVTTPVGGIPQAITDGETGFLVQPGDVQGLGHTIRRVLQDEDLRIGIATRARARALALFDVRSILAQLERIYDSVTVEPRSQTIHKKE